jgi:hypothetical protein
MGDLTLTCSSPTSRNMSLGLQLGQGIPRKECFDGQPVVVEGEMNAVSVTDLARRVGRPCRSARPSGHPARWRGSRRNLRRISGRAPSRPNRARSTSSFDHPASGKSTVNNLQKGSHDPVQASRKSQTSLEEGDFVLATDLDGTFLGGSPKRRGRLYDWIEENRASVGLIFVTGRDPGSSADLTRKGNVPRPDYVIGDVGTTIAAVDEAHPDPDRGLEADIAAAWGDAGSRRSGGAWTGRRACAAADAVPLPRQLRHRPRRGSTPARSTSSPRWGSMRWCPTTGSSTCCPRASARVRRFCASSTHLGVAERAAASWPATR